MTEQAQGNQAFKDRVGEVLGKIRPHIQADGGDIELVDVDEGSGKVSIRFQGSCRGCPMSQMTLKMGVERHMKEQVPEVSEVVAVD
jgi:Fe-S cluster biogenesis protein NfuA